MYSNNYSISKQENDNTNGANEVECIGHTENRKKDWDKPEDIDKDNNVDMKDFISLLDTH